MSEELAISLRGVSKCFKRYDRPVDRLKELLIPGRSRERRAQEQEFWDIWMWLSMHLKLLITDNSSFAHFILKSETLFLPFKFSGNGIECIKMLKCQ